MWLRREFCSNACIGAYRFGKAIRPACKHGHEYTDDNIYIEVNAKKDGKISTAVRCRSCQQSRNKRWVDARVNSDKWAPCLAKACAARAKSKGITFDLTVSEIQAITNQPCHYCGEMGERLRGLDRLKSTVGYQPDNVVACCTQCNTAKSEMTVQEFLSWVARVADYSIHRIGGSY